MNRICTFFFLISLAFKASAQVPEQDCFQAINVCENNYTQANSYSGYGSVSEIPAGQTCLVNGEMNSVWYRFTVTQGGTLTFQLDPLNPNDDYDFAVYSLNGVECADIVSGTNLPLRCNYSAQTGSTGLSASSTQTSAATGDPNQCSPLTVTVGESFVILVSNFTASNSGYELSFGGSASIFDDQPAELVSITNGDICNPEKVWLEFNEELDCASIEGGASDFYIVGPENVIIDQAIGISCGADGFTNEIRLRFTQKIGTPGAYQVFAQTGSDGNTIIDRCGNESQEGLLGSFEVEFIGPDIEIADYQDPECALDDGWIETAVTNGTQPFVYQWSVTSLPQTNFNDSLGSGNFGITVTDANGCTEQVSQILTYLNSPDVVLNDVVGVLCNGSNTGSATVSVAPGSFTGNLTYEWSSDPPQYGPTATNLPSGDVHVHVEDEGNCSSGMIITIPTIDPITVNFSTVEPSCNVADGEIAVTAIGGTGNFSYQWDSGQNTPVATSLDPGVYNCLVEDDNGCQEEIEVVLVNDFAPDAMVNETLASCGQNNGWASVSALSGTSPFAYEWNTAPAQFDSLAIGLNPGNYFCQITDGQGCVQIINVKIDSVPPPSFIASSVMADCGEDNGEIAIKMTGGVSPFVFQIGGDSYTAVSPITDLAPGNYLVTVVDSVGCTAEENVMVEMVQPESNFTVSPVCVGTEAQFYATTNSQATEFSWLFGDGSGSTFQNPVHIYQQPGTYDVILDLTGGCAPDQVVKQVEIFDPPTPAFSSSMQILLQNEPFDLSYTGSPADTVLWNLNQQTHEGLMLTDLEIDAEGVYPLTIVAIDEHGCRGELIEDLEVIERPTLFVPNAFNPNGGGENRVFRVEGIGVTEVNFWVFDRWGKLLFEANNINKAMDEGWDGTYRGQPLPQGVYAYRIKATMLTGKEFESVGTVTMLR